MSNKPTLDDAVRVHRQGRIDEAERIYRDILKREPFSTDALINLAVSLERNGRRHGAIPYASNLLNLRGKPAILHGAIYPIPLSVLDDPDWVDHNPGGAYTEDSPAVPLVPGQMSWGWWAFQTWYMARPVDSHGDPLPGSIWVPLKKVSWSFTVVAEWQNGPLILVNGLNTVGRSNTTTQFPTWHSVTATEFNEKPTALPPLPWR